ncbi:hypothetical protein HDA32_005951 [Spinactinospora alkalitolerans]|uniref:SAF domain-containing protein n=1 Tax=Spinactinospora alkalitolerans TaxID=687207 RepID=A0A852U3R5_9ACTN|nr:SAF domain-containing protein [Spinactinospora alkalitolerans]NYE50831.1 hypothetical protein [Spinactinospora alkalitolerans]
MSVKTDLDETDIRAVDDEIEAMPAVQSLRSRRRPWVVLAGVVLTAVSGAAASALYLAADDRTEVLVVARDVSYGQELAARDLVRAQVALDPAVDSVPAENLSRVVGQRVSADLQEGQLLVPANTRSDVVPARDSQLVAMPLRPGQVPARGLHSGDLVDIVATSGDGDGDPDSPPPTITGRIVQVGAPGAEGVRVVDVETAATDGAELAALAAGGDIALVINPAAAVED